MERRNFLKAAGAAAALPLVGTAHAAMYPQQPVSLVIPFSPGGSTDLIIRPFAQYLSEVIDNPVVVVNRAGAGGAIGAGYVATTKPDGYTVLVGSAGPVIINPLLQDTVTYKPQTDFAAIAVLTVQPLALAVHPDVEAQTMDELIALLKANPGKYFYASSGTGGLPHLTGELFKSRLGVSMEHVPYQGGAPAVQATMSGQTHILFDAVSSLVPHHASGKLRVLGICDAERSSLLPEVPSFGELGLEKLSSTTSNYLLAPSGVPDEVIKVLADASVAVGKNEAYRDVARQMGVRILPDVTGPAAAGYMADEIEKWSGVIREANVVLTK